MEEKKNTVPRQLVSFVFDNSASCSKEKLSALMRGFRQFAAEHAEDPMLCFELSCYDTFQPAVVKEFDGAEIAPVRAGRMPLLARTVLVAADRLAAKAAQLRAEGETLYRPLMFILSDGFTFDDTEEAVARLEEMEHSGALLYLPFKLTPKLYTERLQSLDRTKHMIEIKEGCIDGFFAFVRSVLERRAALSVDVGLKFQKSDFEGWAEL